MKLNTSVMSALFAIACVATLEAGVATKFEQSTDLSNGAGMLDQTHFTWTASKPIAEVRDRVLRWRDFAGGTIEFTFESPVAIEEMLLSNMNATSKYQIEFMDADGNLLEVAEDVTGSTLVPGMKGQIVSMESGVLTVTGFKNSEVPNYDAVIQFGTPVKGVSKIRWSVISDPGLGDLRLTGRSGR